MKRLWAIKMNNGMFFIKTWGNCGWEGDYSLTSRTQTYDSKDRCEIAIMQLKQQFRGFDGKPCQVWGK